MLLLRSAQEAWPDVPVVQKFSEAPKTLETLRKSRLLYGNRVLPLSATIIAFDIGEILCHIIPLLMMRQQRVPRAKWKMHQTERGKRWIERVCLFSTTQSYLPRSGLTGR